MVRVLNVLTNQISRFVAQVTTAVTAVLVLAAILPAQQTSAHLQWIQSPVNNHWYAYARPHLKWHDARRVAQALGADLAVVRNSQESAWIASAFAGQLAPSGWAWIGLSDEQSEGLYQWVDGGSYPIAWSASQPDNIFSCGTDEDYCEIGLTGLINDQHVTGACPGNGTGRPSIFESKVFPGGTVLLEDDFEAPALNPAKWTAQLNYGNSSVTQGGGVVRLQNRPSLISNTGFRPETHRRLVLETRVSSIPFECMSSGPYGQNMQFLLRTDSAVSGQYQQHNSGIGLWFWPDYPGGGDGGISWAANITVGPAAQEINLDGCIGVFDCMIIDTGVSVLAWMWLVSDPTQSSLAWRDGILSETNPKDRLAFQCRESIFGDHEISLHHVRVTGADCNGNAIADHLDIASGVEADCNSNLIPDSCDIATGVPTCSNQALQLNGSSYIRVPDNASLDLTGPFTIECWVKSDNPTSRS
jgi:hypothetical protein